MREAQVTIVEIRDMAQDMYLLTLEDADMAQAVLPGQFVHIRVPGNDAHLLRRPISIMHVDKAQGRLSLAVQRKGRGTCLLGCAREGEKLQVLGPVGKGFTARAGERIYFVGGGVGVAPIRCAMDAFADAQCQAFFGFRSRAHAYGQDNLPCTATVVTDDGTLGEKELVTMPLLRAMKAQRPDKIMACGPTPMLRAIQEIALAQGVCCELSLEEHMGCGIGACLGCNCKVRVKDGEVYKRVCVDGPVFKAEEVCFDG